MEFWRSMPILSFFSRPHRQIEYAKGLYAKPSHQLDPKLCGQLTECLLRYRYRNLTFKCSPQEQLNRKTRWSLAAPLVHIVYPHIRALEVSRSGSYMVFCLLLPFCALSVSYLAG